MVALPGFKQKIKRTMRDRGGKSGSRDINCRTMVGSLGFDGSTDFGIDTEFRAGILGLLRNLGPLR